MKSDAGENVPSDDLDGFEDDDYDREEDDLDNCSGWFDGDVFVCGAVGSEDCDCCPCYKWLGLTHQQIDELEPSDE